MENRHVKEENMKDWKMVIRDAIIILCLIFIGTFIFVAILGAAGAQKLPVNAIAASNILLGGIGFTISGLSTKANRFTHMLKVAFGVWLIGSMNVVFFQTTVEQWFSSIFFILIMMAIGGGISYLLAKPVKTG